jgi:NADH-quinone oxidoreductase subunit C
MTSDEILKLATGLVQSWDWATEASQPSPKMLDVKVKRLNELVAITVALRVKRLGYLSAITGIDLGAEVGEMEVLYQFCPGDVVITLRVRVPRENPVLPSLNEIIPIAEVFERELHEMFGIEITGLRITEHLYLPDDWPAGTYPMRKDFDPHVLSH